MLTPEELEREWEWVPRELEIDHVGVWHLVSSVRRVRPGAAFEDVRDMALQLIGHLLRRGVAKVVVVDPSDASDPAGGYDLKVLPGTPDDVVAEIDRRWRELGDRDPTIAELGNLHAPGAIISAPTPAQATRLADHRDRIRARLRWRGGRIIANDEHRAGELRNEAQAALRTCRELANVIGESTASPTEPARALRAAAATGITPVVSEDEQCHGLWLLWSALVARQEEGTDQREAIEAVMHRAAREWASISEDSSDRRAYLDRWIARVLGPATDWGHSAG